jgi:DNA-directed RNA polymerase subunit RPC12/RpoP
MLQGLGPPEPPKPQYYRVACPEGHLLRGERTEGYQALRCPTCGEGIFVLPRSPLPDPPAPAAERPKKRPAALAAVDEGPITLTDAPPQAEVADAEIVWQDEPAAVPRQDVEIEIPTEAPPQRRPQRPQPAAAQKPAARATQPRPQPAPPVAVRERVPLRLRLRRHRTALILIGVALLVAGTFGVRMLRERRQKLPQVAQKNTTEGLTALSMGEFDVAKDKLGRAARALEELGDEDAPKVRQSANEAAILADLAGKSLEEIVDEVATREDGESQFKSLYRGRSVLIEAPILAVGSSDGKHPYEIEYKLLAGAGGKPRRGRVDLTGFALFANAAPEKGKVVTFGGRLESVTLSTDDHEWHVHLAPDSGVWISSPEAWKALEIMEFSSAATPEEGPR